MRNLANPQIEALEEHYNAEIRKLAKYQAELEVAQRNRSPQLDGGAVASSISNIDVRVHTSAACVSHSVEEQSGGHVAAPRNGAWPCYTPHDLEARMPSQTGHAGESISQTGHAAASIVDGESLVRPEDSVSQIM